MRLPLRKTSVRRVCPRAFGWKKQRKGTCYFHQHVNREMHPAASTERDKEETQHEWWSKQGQEISYWCVMSWRRSCWALCRASYDRLCSIITSDWSCYLEKKKNKTKIGCCVFSVIGPRTEGSRKITSRKCGEVYLLSAPGFVFTKRGTNYYVLRTHCTWGLEFEPVTFGENYSLKHLVVM